MGGVVVSRILLCAIAGPALLGALATPAWAQSSSSPEAAAEGEVIVTAQRRSESIQDVPISIAAFTPETIEAPGANNLTGLNGLVPNVVLQTQGLVPNIPMLSIRGMSSSDPDPNADPKVSTIVDGVYVPFASGTMLDMFDIERVEILKGPQGVLFGKNNLAGTFAITTARPTDEFQIDTRATFGSNGLRQIRGRINSGRFADDMLAAKFSFNLRNYDGYSRNVITGNDLNTDMVQFFRGALDFAPEGPFSSTLVLDWTKQKVNGPAPHTVDNGSAAYLQIPAIARSDVRVSAVNFDPLSNTKTYGASWTGNLDVGAGQITAVVGYRDIEYLTRGDFDGLITPNPGLDVTRQFAGESTSAELRYVSPSGGFFDYVVGLYVQSDEWNQNNTVRSTPTALSTSALRQSTDSRAVFALMNIHPMDALTISLGGRYSEDEKSYLIDAQVRNNGVFVPASSFAGTFQKDWNQFSPRVTASYNFTSDVMAYASYSQGYKAGGFNSRGTVRENVGPYDPETVDAYEIGAKTDWFDRLLRFNATVFLNQFEDLQGAVTRQGAVRSENVTTNIAAAETYGLELEAVLRPRTGLTITGNFARLYAKYTEFCADVDGVFTNGAAEPRQCGPAAPVLLNGTPTGTFSVPVDSTNLELGNAPPYSASLSADYKFETPYGEVGLHGDGRYTSRYNTWGRSNNAAFFRDEVVIFNASVSLASVNDRWSITLYGRNLTDETVLSGATQAGAVPIVQFYQPPKEFGIDLTARF
jgi:iron complex outermembrane recepter protein